MIQYGASCHCGAQLISYSTARPVDEWPLRRCSCDYCTRQQARYTSDVEGHIRLRSDAALIRYRFGLGVADFMSCSICGTYLGAARQDDDGQRMVLNVNLLGLDELDTEPEVMDYDGEATDDRSERQRTRWTPLEMV